MSNTRCSTVQAPDTTNTNILYYNNNYRVSLSFSLSEGFSLIAACMQAQLGYTPNDRARQGIMQLLQAGALPEMICAVIEYTKQNAPRPSWAYAFKVASAQIELGNTTAEAFSAAVEAYWQQTDAKYKPGYFTAQKPQRRVLAQMYEQRPYDASVNDMSPDDLAAAALL